MKVMEYLKRFLSEQPGQEAAVPGLGVFYAGQKNGRHCILFKEVMPTNKAFLNFISFEENITEDQARQEVEKWVRRILQDLKSSGSVNLDGIGTFAIMGDKVEFVPALGKAVQPDADFGLEKPVGEDVRGSDSRENDGGRNPIEGRAGQKRESASGIQNQDRSRSRNTFKKQPDRPRIQAVPNPGGSGKELVLGTSRKGQAKDMDSAETAPFYSRWWFFVVCAVVAVIIVVFAIRPVREKVLGQAAGPVQEMGLVDSIQEAVLEENVDIMMGEDALDADLAMENMSEREKALAEENAMVASQVIAGEVRKREVEKVVEKETRPMEKKEPAVSDPARGTKVTVSKVKTKGKESVSGKPVAAREKTVRKESSGYSSISVERPQEGRFYIIVGSFVSKENALAKARELSGMGYGPSVLYIEAKSYYYVSVKTCTDREQAVAARTDLRDNKKTECWIFAN